MNLKKMVVIHITLTFWSFIVLTTMFFNEILGGLFWYIMVSTWMISVAAMVLAVLVILVWTWLRAYRSSNEWEIE